MATQVQWRGGSTAEHATFTGAAREVTVDTQKQTLVVHDGSTAGGEALLREDQANLPGSVTNGIYTPGTNQVAVATNGTGRLFVDASGNVGVNEGTPLYPLVVRSAGTCVQQYKRGTTVLGYIGEADSILAGGLTTDLAIKADGNLVFGAGSLSERLRITSAGLVGIGTSSPSEKLDVYAGSLSVGSHYVATVNTNYKIQLRSVGPNTNSNFTGEIGVAGSGPQPADSDITFATQTWNGTTYAVTEKARLTAAGRLGVGTTSPQASLHVSASASAAYIGQLLENTSSGGYAQQIFNIGANGANGQATIGYAPGLFFAIGPTANDTTTPIVFRNNNAAERARIDASGRLLVGTSTARGNFFNTSYTPQLQLEGVGQQQSMLSVVNSVGADGGSVLALGKQRSGSIGGNTILQSGDQIGELTYQGSDGTELVAAASITAYVDGTPGANDMPGRLVFSTTADGASSPTERMRISSDGHTYWGVANPGTTAFGTAIGRLGSLGFFQTARNVDGTGEVAFFHGNAGEVRIFGDGDLENTNNSYGGLSDLKLKENIVDASSQWSDLKALQVRKYNFKAETGYSVHTQIGLVAQEVELVSPGLVGETIDEETGESTKSVNYSVLYMKAVKALQETMERIETLEQRLNDAGIN
jgi:hypothetical protein